MNRSPVSHRRPLPLARLRTKIALVLLAALAIFSALTTSAEPAAARPLRDFRRVVIADDALPVQKAAAEELANLAEASRLGFIAAYGEGSKSFATQAPNFWALTHMMWDPQRDSTHLMRDFYESAYGPVAQEMQAFFEAYEHALDANWAKRDRVVDSTEIAYANIMCAWGKLIPQEAIEEAERHLKDAEAKAPAGEYADRVKFHRFGQDYTRTMLGLLNAYRRLAVLGVKMGEFSNVVRLLKEPLVDSPDERDALLHEAYELGERREAMLLAHRAWAGPDEGLYAFTNEIKTRQWHTAVKKALGIDKPTALTKTTLAKP